MKRDGRSSIDIAPLNNAVRLPIIIILEDPRLDKLAIRAKGTVILLVRLIVIS